MATKTAVEPKYVTSRDINNKYNKLSKNKKIEVLYEAIDYMQSYNGRSRFLCIAMAMGYDNNEGLDTTYYKRKSNE